MYNEIDRHSIREVSKDVCDVSEAMSVSAFYKDLIVITYNCTINHNLKLQYNYL